MESNTQAIIAKGLIITFAHLLFAILIWSMGKYDSTLQIARIYFLASLAITWFFRAALLHAESVRQKEELLAAEAEAVKVAVL